MSDYFNLIRDNKPRKAGAGRLPSQKHSIEIVDSGTPTASEQSGESFGLEESSLEYSEFEGDVLNSGDLPSRNIRPRGDTDEQSSEAIADVQHLSNNASSQSSSSEGDSEESYSLSSVGWDSASSQLVDSDDESDQSKTQLQPLKEEHNQLKHEAKADDSDVKIDAINTKPPAKSNAAKQGSANAISTNPKGDNPKSKTNQPVNVHSDPNVGVKNSQDSHTDDSKSIQPDPSKATKEVKSSPELEKEADLLSKLSVNFKETEQQPLGASITVDELLTKYTDSGQRYQQTKTILAEEEGKELVLEAVTRYYLDNLTKQQIAPTIAGDVQKLKNTTIAEAFKNHQNISVSFNPEQLLLYQFDDSEYVVADFALCSHATVDASPQQAAVEDIYKCNVYNTYHCKVDPKTGAIDREGKPNQAIYYGNVFIQADGSCKKIANKPPVALNGFSCNFPAILTAANGQEIELAFTVVFNDNDLSSAQVGIVTKFKDNNRVDITSFIPFSKIDQQGNSSVEKNWENEQRLQQEIPGLDAVTFRHIIERCEKMDKNIGEFISKAAQQGSNLNNPNNPNNPNSPNNPNNPNNPGSLNPPNSPNNPDNPAKSSKSDKSNQSDHTPVKTSKSSSGYQDKKPIKSDDAGRVNGVPVKQHSNSTDESSQASEVSPAVQSTLQNQQIQNGRIMSIS